MPDESDDYGLSAARFRDPRLQTGPFPQWPTLPPMGQATPSYLENDPTAWEGGDFPTHPDPWSIVVGLLGARAARSSPIMARASAAARSGDPGITGGRPSLDIPSALERYTSGYNFDPNAPSYRNSSTGMTLDPRYPDAIQFARRPLGAPPLQAPTGSKGYDIPGGPLSNTRAGGEWIGDRPQVLQDMDYPTLMANREKFARELGRLRYGADTGPGLQTDPDWLERALGKIDAEIGRRKSSGTPKLY